ncbi:hypothetical protein A3B63_00275 [Candidatus Saccharibacteria bacterium RIFCSPLOWO2_01_FULL_49_22]|nr:MAG: hypothetical protein A3B63_00275 [Candidatus Saccharibacteria bacterium RIFCSPLOWO2_01_FULL_49_22]
MSERKQLVHQVVDELRELKKSPPFEPTADIDMVWVISQPGTAKRASEDGIYKGISNDRKVIDYGIELIKEITALRLGKAPEEVTKEDIEASGPTLFYNGEDRNTRNSAYPQIEDLEELIDEPDFPVPRSKIVIDHIPELGTHTQVKGFFEYLQQRQLPEKVAVVSMIHHSRRVARYLEHYKDQLPEGVSLVNAPVAETHETVGITLREVRKIADYAEKGDLSRDPLEGF